MVDAILYVVGDAKGLLAIARHLSGAHPRILFVTAAAIRRMGIDACAVRTLSHGGPLSTLLAQVAHEPTPLGLQRVRKRRDQSTLFAFKNRQFSKTY